MPVALNLQSRAATKRPSHRAVQARNEAILARLEVDLARSVKNARTAFVAACAHAYEHEGDRAFDGELIAHRVALAGLLTAQARRTVPRFARLTLGEIALLAQKAADEDGWFERLIRDWLAAQGLQRARLIAETARQDILRALQAGTDAGEGTEAIARRIRKVSALSPWRAATIAATETHQAALFAQAEAAKRGADEHGLQLEKVWLATLDHRTRDAHRAMNKIAVPIGEKFIVAGVPMDRPGDPSAPPELVCRCRCTLIHREMGNSA